MHRLLPAIAGALLLLGPLPLSAQEGDLTELFDRGPFYEQAGVLRGKGDIPFFADVSFLRGRADSTQTVLGIALSNSAFQFVKEEDGYRAAYEVALRLEGERGSFRNEWREDVRVASFDETLINRETVVFQSSFGLLPGEYELELRVRDAQSGQTSEVERDLEVPRIETPAGGYALSEPVLLRFYREARADGLRDHVLYPSHYYETVPREVSFFVEVYAAPEASPPAAGLLATISPLEGGDPVSNVTLDLPALPAGGAGSDGGAGEPAAVEGVRVYGTIPGEGMQAGIYRLAVALRDSAGGTLAESSVRLSVSAITQWVRENWEEALELVAYEATDEERERLEATPPEERLEAWSDFWSIRDPVPSTPGNEAFEEYFRRISVANANFTTKLRPGWKSDRGRVYVAFGPPTDVIRRPMPSGTFPLEIWVYDAPGFEIVFEDRVGFGNYQIANPGTFANELAALERRKHRAIAERRAKHEDEQRRSPDGEGATPADTTRG